MNPESQRIAIATACGWEMQSIGLMKKGDDWARPDSLHGHRCIPEYLNDLNAMHEAEKILTMEQASRYGEQIARIAERGVEFHEDTQIGPLDLYAWSHLTAAQRAESFLCSIGKWDESK